jgi:hypothetical protein
MAPDRGGYTLTMRECQGSEEALEALATPAHSAQTLAPRLHMGWGSFRNLDIVAARRSAWALLVDVNLHQFRVWSAVETALAHPSARTAEHFIDVLLPLLPTVPRLRQFAVSTRRWLRSDLERPGSWMCLDAPERFDWVRALFGQGRVHRACLDMRGGPQGHGTFAELRRRLDQAVSEDRVMADTFYVSNLPWILAQPIGFFGERHDAHMPQGSHSAGHAVWQNLAELAPAFDTVTSAARLRADATADNLQWETQCLTPEAFLKEGIGHPCFEPGELGHR